MVSVLIYIKHKIVYSILKFTVYGSDEAYWK